MNLLQLLQEVSERIGLPKPLSVVDSQDDSVLQLRGKLNEVLEDLTLEPWTLLTKTTTWAQLAQEDQGPMATLAPFGYEGIINRTFYDRTQKLEVVGPLSEQEWQLLQAVPMTAAYLQYRIIGGHMILNGVLQPGHVMAFSYHSNWAVLAADGTTWKSRFMVDTDTCAFSDKLLMAGLTWKWKAQKGLRYQEDFRRYEILKANEKGREGSQRPLSMSDEPSGFSPGVFVPQFSWKITQ